MTKRYRITFFILSLFHFMINVLPVGVYLIKAYMESTLVGEKIVMSTTLLIVIMFTLISFINKVAFRCRIWILLIGLYICLDYIMTPIIIFAICQTTDELILSPLFKLYGNKLRISKEMDKRLCMRTGSAGSII